VTKIVRRYDTARGFVCCCRAEWLSHDCTAQAQSSPFQGFDATVEGAVTTIHITSVELLAHRSAAT